MCKNLKFELDSQVVNVLQEEIEHEFCSRIYMRPTGYRSFFMLNSLEHEICSGNNF